ncbi:MAG: XdhC family protein, partial [Chloroflexota bacterium]|nr:XdhC family protein [Chloroflexota bacterium]
MIELLDQLHRWRGEGVAVGRAVLIKAYGSAPRPEGAVLLATADGRIAGSVSGGCVEAAVVADISEVRRQGR